MGLCSDDDRALPLELTPLLEPVEDGLAAPGAARILFQRWFDIRRRLYQFLLLDRGEFAAKAMLTLAVELAVEAKLLGPDDWRLTDEGLLDALHERSIGEHQEIGQLVKRIRIGDLFECVGVWETPTMNEYGRLSEANAKRELEGKVENQLARSGGSKLRICLHYILDNKKTCRALSFRDLKTGAQEVVGHDSGTLLVGAFVTNARVTGLALAERKRACEVLVAALEGSGLKSLSPALEPLAEPPYVSGLLV
jgi:hypothetical protein